MPRPRTTGWSSQAVKGNATLARRWLVALMAASPILSMRFDDVVSTAAAELTATDRVDLLELVPDSYVSTPAISRYDRILVYARNRSASVKRRPPHHLRDRPIAPPLPLPTLRRQQAGVALMD